MAIRVDENLQRMSDALAEGDTAIVAVALAADDEIDAMNVSLTERCYDLLRREAPMASDLRFIVSVLRILGVPGGAFARKSTNAVTPNAAMAKNGWLRAKK